jgi:hypothetical protein
MNRHLCILAVVLGLVALGFVGADGHGHHGHSHGPPRGNGRLKIVDRLITRLEENNQTDLADRLSEFRENFANNTAPADRTVLDTLLDDLAEYANSTGNVRLIQRVEQLVDLAKFEPLPLPPNRGRKGRSRGGNKGGARAYSPADSLSRQGGGAGGQHKGSIENVIVVLREQGKTDLADRLKPYVNNFKSQTFPTDQAQKDALSQLMTEIESLEASLERNQLKRALGGLINRYKHFHA